MNRYAVIGHPVEHSKSPFIHAAFAAATGEPIEYGRLLAPLNGFATTAEGFRREGGAGLNVTVPFKLEAFELARHRTARAEAAGAVNTLSFRPDGIHGDNTDGAGLVTDLTRNLGVSLAGARILLAGAGGAARGVVLPLMQAGADTVVIANRTPSRAHELVATLTPHLPASGQLHACAFEDSGAWRFDIVINATSASLGGAGLPLEPGMLSGLTLAYDMMYGTEPTAFLRQARAAGAARVADGLGMLVAQAAESFYVWRGVRPDIAPVLGALRQQMDGEHG